MAPVSWSARVVLGCTSSSIGTKYGEMGGANSGARPALAAPTKSRARAEAARRSIGTAVVVVVGSLLLLPMVLQLMV